MDREDMIDGKACFLGKDKVGDEGAEDEDQQATGVEWMDRSHGGNEGGG
jgi:hypothetical protein